MYYHMPVMKYQVVLYKLKHAITKYYYYKYSTMA